MATIGYFEIVLAIIGFVLITHMTNRSGLPKSWPIFGMIPQFLLHVNEFHEWVVKIMEISECNFFARGITFLNDDMLFTVDLPNIHFVLTSNFESFPKGPEFKKIFEVLGDGIFNSDSDLWKSQRRTTQKILSHGGTLKFFGKLTREKLEDALKKMLDEFSERGTVFDLQDLFDRLSFDLSCKLVTGFDQKSLSIDLPEVKFSKALNDAEEAIFYRHVFPKWSWKFQKMFGIDMERKLERSWKILDNCIAEFIGSKREEVRDGVRGSEVEEGTHMLKFYMLDTGSLDEVGENDKFFRDTILNLMIAGRDTIASALTWFFLMLSRNPLVENKIREEIDSLMQKNGFDLQFLENEIPNMVYLHGAIYEFLRLYPPVPLQHKLPTKPVVLPSGHHVHPGMKIIVPLYAMGRMKSIWGEDSWEVKPERWISERGVIRREPSYKFLSFNAGPRSCLGREVALRQVKIITAFIVYNYDVQVLEGQSIIPYANSLSYSPSNGGTTSSSSQESIQSKNNEGLRKSNGSTTRTILINAQYVGNPPISLK